MEDEGRITSANRSEKTSAAAPDETAATPHFDAAAVVAAQPAVPLSQVESRRSWKTGVLLTVAIMAGLAGGLIGGILPGLFLKDNAAQRADSEQAPADDTVVEPGRSPEQTAPVQTAPEAVTRGAGEEPSDTRSVDREPSESAGVEGPVPKEMEATLRGALDDWVAATNARDIDKQMRFYNPVVDAFYLMRNASRADVRADKARVFERASSIDVHAGAPDIRLSPDGRTAIMRFHKRYAIEGGGEDRRGEVVQELRWQRINGEWKIISERDLRVISK